MADEYPASSASEGACRSRRSRPDAFIRWVALACVLPVARRAARAYIAGERLEDALRVAQRHTDAGRERTIGLFNADDDAPRKVADVYLESIRAVAGTESHVAIKWPALGFSRELLAEVAEQAKRSDVDLIFDGMWPAAAAQTHQAIGAMLATGACGRVGLALPGRWRRSVADARWAADRGLLVRVVKGQWPDPEEPDRDMRRGFLEVIESLAGRAREVAVASHDPPLAERALDILQAAGTPCELELLHGFPMRPMLAMAQRRNVRVRVYVPFGSGHLPYAIAQVIRKPRLAWWLLKDAVGSSHDGM